eukprot:Colp12_sorted_trinity150504_noHs@5979
MVEVGISCDVVGVAVDSGDKLEIDDKDEDSVEVVDIDENAGEEMSVLVAVDVVGSDVIAGLDVNSENVECGVVVYDVEADDNEERSVFVDNAVETSDEDGTSVIELSVFKEEEEDP